MEAPLLSNHSCTDDSTRQDCRQDEIQLPNPNHTTSTWDGLENGSEMEDGSEMEGGYIFDGFDIALYQITVPFAFSLISIAGLVGNSLVIYVIVSRERMRTVTNLLLLNLAIADLLFVLVIPPFTAYQFATAQFPFGDVVCKLMHYLVNVTAYTTVYTLVLISIIRYMTIVHNTSTVRLRTRANIISTIVIIWSLMLLLNIPIILSYKVQMLRHGPECLHNSHGVGQSVFATFFAFAYVLPLGIIAILSLCILHHITIHRPQALDRTARRSTSRKVRAGQLLVLVVVVFAIFWLPIHIHLLVAFFGHVPNSRTYQAISLLWYCLAYSNSCINPFLYNQTSKDFRDAFADVVCSCCCYCCCCFRGCWRSLGGASHQHRFFDRGQDGGEDYSPNAAAAAGMASNTTQLQTLYTNNGDRMQVYSRSCSVSDRRESRLSSAAATMPQRI